MRQPVSHASASMASATPVKAMRLFMTCCLSGCAARRCHRAARGVQLSGTLTWVPSTNVTTSCARCSRYMLPHATLTVAGCAAACNWSRSTRLYVARATWAAAAYAPQRHPPCCMPSQGRYGGGPCFKPCGTRRTAIGVALWHPIAQGCQRARAQAQAAAPRARASLAPPAWPALR